jgi:hypothetical protein
MKVVEAIQKERCNNCCRIGNLHIQCTQEEGHYGYCYCTVKCEYGGQEVSVMWGTPRPVDIDNSYEIPF